MIINFLPFMSSFNSNLAYNVYLQKLNGCCKTLKQQKECLFFVYISMCYGYYMVF